MKNIELWPVMKTIAPVFDESLPWSESERYPIGGTMYCDNEPSKAVNITDYVMVRGLIGKDLTILPQVVREFVEAQIAEGQEIVDNPAYATENLAEAVGGSIFKVYELGFYAPGTTEGKYQDTGSVKGSVFYRMHTDSENFSFSFSHVLEIPYHPGAVEQVGGWFKDLVEAP